MRFDWPRFLRNQHIEFVTHGPNTAKDAVSVRCPWCGDADPSEHMGISLKGRGWGCLRNSAHRGKSNARLISKLLNCSLQEAERLSGKTEATAPEVDDFSASFAALKAINNPSAPTINKELRLLPEFKPLLNGSPLSRPFIFYLEERGYRKAQITWLAKNYQLRYATKGDFEQRIIIPIQDRYGSLLSWTARTIRKDIQPRYKTLRMRSDDPMQPVARLAANNTLLGLPTLWGANNPRALILVEGPFDALKLTAFGRGFGIYGASLFGLNVYSPQVAEIEELSSRFPSTYLLLDHDAELHRLRLRQSLSAVNVKILKMPDNLDDPGAMTGSQVVNFCLNLVDG